MEEETSSDESQTPQKQTIHLTVDFDKKSTFIGRSVEGGFPVTLPLKDLENLLAWKPDDQNDPGQTFSVSTVPYYGKHIPKGSTKTLVCHDMAGGYLDDRFVQGSICTDDKWYYLVYWDVVDTFVYFSHDFITIPPVGWINSAHANGVAVLGTLITEWDVGFKRCEAIFSHEWLWKKVADIMVQIAKYYRFEGWLLNIENKISKENIENVRCFVKYLANRLHDAIEGSLVLWYDSVTIDGKLKWQNELNSKNMVFFEECDGICLNYGWNKGCLERSAEAAAALGRLEDVYVGVDVFGRGSYGGGGMHTAAAVEVMRRYKLSAAIFAPGWVKEVLGSQHFEKNQRKFWTSLGKNSNTHTVIANPEHLYLETDFNPGVSIQEKSELRLLHLNQQAMMPCLSNSLFAALKIEKGVMHSIGIAKDSTVLLYKTRISVLSGKLIVYAEADHNFTLRFQMCDGRTHQAVTESLATKTWKGSRYARHAVLKCNRSIIHKICCVTSHDAVELKKLVISAVSLSGTEAPVICPQKPSASIALGIRLQDVTWKRAEKDDSVLLMSCTLALSNTEPTLPTKLFLKVLECDYVDLGISLCGLYRICDLRVPNPVYDGPGTKITLKAEQSSPVFPIIEPNLPSRMGELIVSYGENMPEPLSEA